jgi:hypothetical protein
MDLATGSLTTGVHVLNVWYFLPPIYYHGMIQSGQFTYFSPVLVLKLIY